MKAIPNVGEIETKALKEGWCIQIREFEDDKFMSFSDPTMLSGRELWFFICHDQKVVLRGKLGTVEWSAEIGGLIGILDVANLAEAVVKRERERFKG